MIMSERYLIRDAIKRDIEISYPDLARILERLLKYCSDLEDEIKGLKEIMKWRP